MRKLGAVLLVAISLGLGYLAYQNTRTPHPVDAQAEGLACDDLAVCDGDTVIWTRLEATPFVRRYGVDDGRGAVTIECRWSLILFGDVNCTADRQAVPKHVPDRDGPAPHELRRGER